MVAHSSPLAGPGTSTADNVSRTRMFTSQAILGIEVPPRSIETPFFSSPVGFALQFSLFPLVH